MLYADLHLSRQLEGAEAHGNKSFVEVRAQVDPALGATWLEVAGTYALFDGAASPLTQTFGLGLFGEVTAAQLAELEAFFLARNAPVLHEISPLATPSLLPLLCARGYEPVEYTNVLFQALTALVPSEVLPKTAVSTRLIQAEEADLWARTAARGWSSEAPELADFLTDLGQISARSAVAFLAELAGRPVATGALVMNEEVALLAGASTVPEARRQGAQAALLAARLRYARAHGCTIASLAAHPGSQSQRNAEKQGFRIAYTRTKWQLTK